MPGAFLIDLALVRPDPSQPRRSFEPAELAQLAASIRERGVRQPIRVRPVDGAYVIVSGERRFRAATEAGLAQIPCIVDVNGGGVGDGAATLLVDQIVENWQREDLSPFELSDALASLRDVHGLPQNEIARRTGKPKSEVSRLLSMQRVAPDVQDVVRSGIHGVSRRHVVTLAQLPEADQRRLVGRIIKERLSAIETEREGRRMLRRRGGSDDARTRSLTWRFAGESVMVEVRFQKSQPTRESVVEALDAARAAAGRETVAGGWGRQKHDGGAGVARSNSADRERSPDIVPTAAPVGIPNGHQTIPTPASAGG